MHFFGSLKGRNNLFRDGNWSLGARVAAYASRMLTHRKRSETTEFNPVASGKPVSNGMEDCIYDLLDVTLKQMWSLRGKFLDQFGLDHVWQNSLLGPRLSEGCQSIEWSSSNSP
jgi:hypothetical protein